MVPVREPPGGMLEFTSPTTQVSVISGLPNQAPTTTIYHIHQDLLFSTSAFFRRQNSALVTFHAGQHQYSLSNFRIYVNWLYYGSICSQEEVPEADEYDRLAWLNELEYMLGDDTFQAAVADAFFERSVTDLEGANPRLPSLQCIQTLFWLGNWRETLRKMVAEIYARHATQEDIEAVSGQLGTNATGQIFLLSVTRALQAMRLQPIPRLSTLPSCFFHTHGANEPCPLQAQPRTRRHIPE